MRRTPIPPGAVGIVIVAAAAAPALLRKMKPLARSLGKGFRNFGQKLEEAAEEPHDKGRTGREDYESQFSAHRKVRREGSVTQERETAAEAMPPVETASPTGQNEVEARESEPMVKKAAAKGKGASKPKQKERGASAGATNSKKAKKETRGKAS
ncbi:MAG TPA: hypothetical protein VM328_07620 [Fimbriimonadaceae bacterium]|nr:hypothetical protein [Fimbriimonadaceae bacterium]